MIQYFEKKSYKAKIATERKKKVIEKMRRREEITNQKENYKNV